MRRENRSPETTFDILASGLIAGELVFSLSSAAILLHFRSLRCLSSLWSARLFLLLLASLISLSELLRLPSPLSRRFCTAHSLISSSLAQPAFLSTLLFLLRSSSQTPPSPAAGVIIAGVTASLPLLFFHALFLSIPDSFLLQIGLPPPFLGGARAPCAVPLFSTFLLAALAAVYVPLFVSAVWSVVEIVINRRLQIRLYILSIVVTCALSVQIPARALAALWSPRSALGQGLYLLSFTALLVAIIAGEVILVLQPLVDSIAIEKDAAACEKCSSGGGGV